MRVHPTTQTLLARTNRCTMAKIDIWQPRWKDRVVLIARHKVGYHTYITFSKTPSMPGTYYISGDDIRACPVGTNGKVACYEVPIDKLTLEEE